MNRLVKFPNDFSSLVIGLVLAAFACAGHTGVGGAPLHFSTKQRGELSGVTQLKWGKDKKNNKNMYVRTVFERVFPLLSVNRTVLLYNNDAGVRSPSVFVVNTRRGDIGHKNQFDTTFLGSAHCTVVTVLGQAKYRLLNTIETNHNLTGGLHPASLVGSFIGYWQYDPINPNPQSLNLNHQC